MSIRIPLTRGFETIIDEWDQELVSAHKWFARCSDIGRYYACRSVRVDGKTKSLYLHRFLLGLAGGQHADHINGDTLDNRRANLRPATNRQNSANQRLRRGNSSGFKGVYWNEESGKWVANIHAGHSIYLGLFEDPRDAAVIYDRAALEHFGAFARTNRSLGLLP